MRSANRSRPFEVGGQIADTRTGGARHPLDRPEEPAHDSDPGVLQQRERPDQQPGVQDHVLQITTGAKGIEEAHRLACDEAAEHGISWSDEPSGSRVPAGST